MTPVPIFPPLPASERRWLLWSTGIVLGLSLIPYLLCAIAPGSGEAFTGFLVNPADGFTYLAKMRMGFQGGWIYHLPFTLERGPGAFLFTYYFALGHFARIFDLPLIMVFHIARIIGGFALLWMVYLVIANITEEVRLRKLTWWIVAFSSGLGWISQKFDLGWSYYYQQIVLYASAFYSLVANPHWPLAMAVMLLMYLQLLRQRIFSPTSLAVLSCLSLVLAILVPFTALVVYLVAGATLAAIWWRDGCFPRAQVVTLFIAGLITASLLIFEQMQISADYTLRALAEHSTPTPGFLGMLLSYGLLWPFAIIGVQSAWRRKSDWDLLLLVWVALVIALSYVPYHMQWRFQMGLHIPIAILAAQGLVRTIRGRWARHLMVAAMMSTSVYLVIHLVVSRTSVSIASVHYPLTFLSAHEVGALNWLRREAPPGVAVLASMEMNLFIPAYAGQRVVAGHGVETFDARGKSKLVRDFFSGSLDRPRLLRELSIDYLVIGSRDHGRSTVDPASLPVQLAFRSGDVSVYKVDRTVSANGRGASH